MAYGERSSWRRAFDSSSWVLEFSEIGLSLLSLVAMLALLIAYDGHEVFNWHGVTLNAVIAVLSVTLKASFTSAIAASIGQWKWILFYRESRTLMDFDRIDLATRGGWGALSVLSFTTRATFVRIGALIILMAVALDPFSQQLVQLQTDVVFRLDHSAVNARNERYSKGKLSRTVLNDHQANQTTDNSLIEAILEPSMEAAISSALSRPSSLMSRWLDIQCPSSNCTWPSFETLGVCYQCQDLTSQLTKIDGHEPEAPSSAWALPNGLSLSNLDTCVFGPVANTCSISLNNDAEKDGGKLSIAADQMYFMGFGTGNPNRTLTMRQFNTLIWSLTAVHLDLAKVKTQRENSPYRWPNVPVVATECALYYCVKQISSVVVNGKLNENTTELAEAVRDWNSWSSWRPSPWYHDEPSLEFSKQNAIYRKKDLSLRFTQDDTKPAYNITDNAVFSISSYFQSSFSLNYNASYEHNHVRNKTVTSNCWFVGSGGPSPVKLGSLWSDKDSDLRKRFSTIADGMTNEIRSVRDFDGRSSWLGDLVEAPREPGTPPLKGRSGVSTIRFKIVWGWISFHISLLVAGVLFFLITIQRSASTLDCVPWKNSSLAIISLAHKFGKVFGPQDTVKELEAKAKDKQSTLSENLMDIEDRTS